MHADPVTHAGKWPSQLYKLEDKGSRWHTQKHILPQVYCCTASYALKNALLFYWDTLQWPNALITCFKKQSIAVSSPCYESPWFAKNFPLSITLINWIVKRMCVITAARNILRSSQANFSVNWDSYFPWCCPCKSLMPSLYTEVVFLPADTRNKRFAKDKQIYSRQNLSLIGKVQCWSRGQSKGG